MTPALTVAMPTFNRAALFDEQLAWFARAVDGREGEVELIVSDNCSTDETPEVIARWQRILEERGVTIRAFRNDENIGAIRNIAACMRRARGTHVWTVGDDDAIDDAALGHVLDLLGSTQNVSLLILNFSSRHWKTKELRFARCFEIEADEVVEHGKELVERFLSDPHPSRWGGLVLTTALVYRTETVQAALDEWPAGLDNITLQLFLTARCALEGATVLTKETHVEMAAGRHFFDKDPMMHFRFRIADIPEAFVKLAEIGYSPALCQQKILNQRKELRLRTVARLFSKQPVATLGVLRRHLAASRRLVSGRAGRSVRRDVRRSAQGGSTH